MKKDTPNIEQSEAQIIQKLERFCAYRERCAAEIKQKLYDLSVPVSTYENYIQYLKDNNYFNEERFANAFVRGKNTIKKWGRKKILVELQSKNIDALQINQSMLQIDEGIYLLRLEDILTKKSKTIKENDIFRKKQKLIQFALQKGYEYELINEVLKTINL